MYDRGLFSIITYNNIGRSSTRKLIHFSSSMVYKNLSKEKSIFISFHNHVYMIATICYWNGKLITGKNSASYEGPPPIAIIIRSLVTFEEFMDLQIPVSKVIELPITNKKCWRSPFRWFSHQRNSMELYISINIVKPPNQSLRSSFIGFVPSNLASNYHEGGTFLCEGRYS